MFLHQKFNDFKEVVVRFLTFRANINFEVIVSVHLVPVIFIHAEKNGEVKIAIVYHADIDFEVFANYNRAVDAVGVFNVKNFTLVNKLKVYFVI